MSKPAAATTQYPANHGEPCRFCRKPFHATAAQIQLLRDSLPGEYEDMTDQQVADDLEICAPCAGIES